MFFGGVLIVTILLSMFVSGLSKEHALCNEFYDDLLASPNIPVTDSTVTADPWIIASHCNGVENNVYMAYYFIALGVSLLVTGIVVRG